MKVLISATLSLEAAAIYNNWEKQQKSRILSEMIVKQEVYRTMAEDMKVGIDKRNKAISRVMWELSDNPTHKALCTHLNKLLEGTLYYQF
tara:strand:+ start:382 stop:651 length:270 start_codon:yes stop_codon:yes gene_type:complete